MNTRGFVVALCFAVSFTCPVSAQHTNLNADENMDPANFTQLLKDEWTFLRDETDAYQKNIAAKNEFETTREFEQRKSNLRAAFLKKIDERINDTKMAKRMFGVLFKTNFVAYNADAEAYALSCAQTIEAPYDIPMVVCKIPSNNYVMIVDTVERGFRKSQITLAFNPSFTWHVSREIARMAKDNQGNIYFRVHFDIDLSQNNFTDQCTIRIVPKDICLLDIQKNQIYWREPIQ